MRSSVLLLKSDGFLSPHAPAMQEWDSYAGKQDWVQIPTPQLCSWVNFSKLPYLSEPLHPHLYNGDNKTHVSVWHIVGI